MLKKFATVAVGVSAGLVALAPLASAGEAPQDSGHSRHHGDHDGGHRHGKNNANGDCHFRGGDAGAGSDVDGDSPANVVTQAPVAGNAIGNIADCSSFLDGNLNHNFSDNHVALVGDNAVIGD